MNRFQLYWDEHKQVVAAPEGSVPDWRERDWRAIMGGKALPESIVAKVVSQFGGRFCGAMELFSSSG